MIHGMRVFFGAAVASVLAASVGACGFYTNVPAQISVVNVKPGQITYNRDSGKLAIEYEQPEMNLRVEHGSIGATFNKMNVAYFYSNGAKADTEVPPLNLGMTVRVDTGVYPTNIRADAPEAVDPAQVGNKVLAPITKVNVPILTRHVTQFGLKSELPTGNAAAIYAVVNLTGYDDANFETRLEAFVPITFIGQPGAIN